LEKELKDMKKIIKTNIEFDIKSIHVYALQINDKTVYFHFFVRLDDLQIKIVPFSLTPFLSKSDWLWNILKCLDLEDPYIFTYEEKWRENKRAMMALDRSPELSNSSKQLPRQAFWPSLMTGESKMW
jgi:hypothetical protein